MKKQPFSSALGVLVLATVAVSAQSGTAVHEAIRYPYDTGAVFNTGSRSETVVSFPVKAEGAGWLAGEHLAGTGATLRITSFLDGDVQELSQVNVRQWRETTAYFNGDTVLVEVVAAPGTGASRLVLGTVGSPVLITHAGLQAFLASPKGVCADAAAGERLLAQHAEPGPLRDHA
jgi:hypothetical protein